MSVLIPALDDARRAARASTSGRASARSTPPTSPPACTCRAEEAVGGRHRALARGQQGPGRAADPAPAGAAHARSATRARSSRCPGVRLPSLLDPKPLERNLRHWIDWDDVHRTSTTDRVDACSPRSRPPRAPAARSCSSRATASASRHRSHAIDYVRDAARRPARARLGRDPDPVPAGARRAARARRAAGTSTAAPG